MDNNYPSDGQLDVFINNARKRLYYLLVDRFEDYFETTVAVNIVSGTSDYALPADFHKALEVDILLDGSTTDYVSIRRYTTADRNRLNINRIWSLSSPRHLRYSIKGDNLRFVPTPSSTETGRLRYAAKPAALSGPTDAISKYEEPWDEYIELGAAVAALQREESDTTLLVQLMAKMERDIKSAAARRDAAEPGRVSDTRGLSHGWDGDFYCDV